MIREIFEIIRNFTSGTNIDDFKKPGRYILDNNINGPLPGGFSSFNNCMLEVYINPANEVVQVLYPPNGMTGITGGTGPFYRNFSGGSWNDWTSILDKYFVRYDAPQTLTQAQIAKFYQNTQLNLNIVPVGTILIWPFPTLPNNTFKEMKRQDLNKRTYSALWNLVKNNPTLHTTNLNDYAKFYSADINSDTGIFSLPDYRGAFLRMAGISPINSIYSASFGTYQLDTVKRHSHTYIRFLVVSYGTMTNTYGFGYEEPNYIANTGETGDNEGRPFNFSVNFIIKVI